MGMIKHGGLPWCGPEHVCPCSPQHSTLLPPSHPAPPTPRSLCDILLGLVDGGHVNSSKQVAIHVINTR